MKTDVIILVAESNDQHFELIRQGLWSVGIRNEMLRFPDGQQLLDFLFTKNQTFKRKCNKEYLLLLDILIPSVDGVKVLEKIKHNKELKKISVIVLTELDDPETINHCYNLGCSIYVIKPFDQEGLTDTVHKIGLFLDTVEMPIIGTIT